MTSGGRHCQTTILDNGIHCQTCGNRAQIFGLVDAATGWHGDCSVCNILWYRRQVAIAGRSTLRGLLRNDLFGMGPGPSCTILAFANLDNVLHHAKCVHRHTINMYKAMITTAAVSDVDYFQSMDEAVAKYPLTFLDDLCVCGGGLQLISRNFVHRAGTYYLSVFDIVASSLCPGLLMHMVE